MTRYEQGFMNKCAEYGVDRGVAMLMLKQAQAAIAKGEVDAGIGTFAANRPDAVRPDGSYTSMLEGNRPEEGYVPYAIGVDPRRGMPNELVSQRALNLSRGDAANLGAQTLFPAGSDPHLKVRANLVNAGSENQRRYRSTGKVTPREAPDLTGLEEFKFTPEELEQLRILQNTMASANGSGRRPSIA